ncbi:elongation factor P maturation arginine rhamnosyltransferase EarP [Leptothrix discophora]|uniref:Protein-arginine rhamnosyltransferase n=1 Tax=Leptothrix discophora TaxID=89 RepID=A0ABT9FZY0_LEPDI|nr:elongation factor P maturation arginine rhamnosyltransferase EarP [Leptothrix discophora]MDP4299508.1 elongation factor P maturation arginine rhamnosyltransferase EarP [Leptothrix discophora]
MTPTRPSGHPAALHWDVFCRVIDNHGDVGVCWRLSADLAARGHAVRLWIDDASALTWMAPVGADGVQLQPWRDPLDHEQPGDVVVEAFGCDPPSAFVARMAASARPPLWINLEYLSAEPYVERSHGLRSPQLSGPACGLDKWFFYPGFTAATGGLLREAGVLPAAVETVSDRPLHLTLFSYDPSGLSGLRKALAALPCGARVDVTPGWSARSVVSRLGLALDEAVPVRDGVITWQALPHVDQPGFDRQLRASDLLLVRGEDSLVRALWSGRPFVWQLYPQDDGAHADKLEAFLGLYLKGAEPALVKPLAAVWRSWNGLDSPASGNAGDDTAAASAWARLLPDQPLWPVWQAWALKRAMDMLALPDLVSRLLDFIDLRRGDIQTV